MMKTDSVNRPLIEVFYVDSPHASERLKKLSEGIEEEGVPYRFTSSTENTDIVELAAQAANASTLEVGVGMGADGRLVLHYRKLPENEPLFELFLPYSDSEVRRFGSHAARLVKGLPFKMNDDE